jgi:hypothetical protein
MKTRSNLLAIFLTIALAFDVGLHLRTPLPAQAQTTMPLFTSLSAVTTGTGTAVSCTNAIQVGWSVIWSSGVTGGEVTIEAANSATYAGTWAVIDVQNFTAAPAANSIMLGTYPGPFQFVRARVTSTVTDGTVTVTISRINGSN